MFDLSWISIEWKRSQDKKKLVKLAKGLFKLTATIGTGIIINNILKSVTPENTNPAKKAAILVGGFVLSDMIVEKVGEEADKSWNRTVKSFKEVKDSFKDVQNVISSEKHTF